MNDIHFGGLIRELIEKKDGTVTGGAERLEYTVQALYAIFEKEDVNTGLLKKISTAYDLPITYFFSKYSETVGHLHAGESRAAYGGDYKPDAVLRIAVLESEKKGLEEQVRLLREMVDVLKTRDK